MTIKERIEVLKRQQKEQEEEIKKLEDILYKDWEAGLVNPENEDYYYIKSSSEFGFDIEFSNNPIYRKPKHAFRTKEQANLIKEKILLLQEMYAFAHVKNKGEVGYYGICINRQNQLCLRFVDEHVPIINIVVFGVFLTYEADAKEMLEIFGDRIKECYNKQY